MQVLTPLAVKYDVLPGSDSHIYSIQSLKEVSDIFKRE